MTAAISVPNGCAACGVDFQEHAQRWHPDTGRHGWIAPTDEQRLTRMRARREARRVHGNGRAPYERDGEIVTRPREGGGTVYQLAE